MVPHASCVPNGSSSLQQPVREATTQHQPVLRSRGTVSTFGDASITTEDYDEVKTQLSDSMRSRFARGDTLRPFNVRYDTRPGVGRLGPIAEYNPGHPCMLDVGAASRVVRRVNQEVLPSKSRYFLRTRATETQYTGTGKATYSVYIVFHKRLLPAGEINPQPEQRLKQGCAIHIGEGLFLTNMHVLQWLRNQHAVYTHATHVARVYLRSGSGNLAQKGAPGGPKDLKAEAVAWSPSVLSAAHGMGYMVRGGLMDGRCTVPTLGDFALLKAKGCSWLARLRCPARPYVLPMSITPSPTNFQ